MNELSDKIAKYLTEFTEEVQKGLEKDIEEVAKLGEEKLSKESPKRTGAYASGWTISKTQTGKTIHNKKKAGLTHILEKGYTARGGKRVKPREHIKPVEEWIIDEIEKRTEERLKNGKN